MSLLRNIKFATWASLAISLLVGGFSALSLAAEEKQHPVKPFLWKIEGKDLKKPSYLFGTIHLSSPVIANLHPAAEKAFNSADALYTEIPLSPEEQLKMMPLLIRKDGKTLSESIGDDLAAKLNLELKAIQPELNSAPFESMKTWAVGAVLPLLKSQLQGHQALDALLWKRAIETGKQTAGIETGESQVGVFEKFSEDECKFLLTEIISQFAEERAAKIDSIANLMDAYTSGDEAKVKVELDKGLTRIAKSERKEVGQRFMQLLLTDRNITMAATIDEKLRSGADKISFFAVGTAHLIGDGNIGSELTAKGYRVTRIQD